MIVDHYSNWPIVKRSTNDALGLINTLRITFATFGTPDELTSDGGPEFIAHTTGQFLAEWGIHHRLSSVAFPHSNCRAEIGVKTIKRLVTNNVGPKGDINVVTLQCVILQYRNTPDQDTKLSSAMCIFGRPTRDLIPILPGKYHPHQTWRESLLARDEALRNRHIVVNHEKWKEHTTLLPPLHIGDQVRIQNQTGPNPNKWDKTGTVIEVHQYYQYSIKVDGSGRIILRNRKFLRKYKPIYDPKPKRTILEDLALLQPVLQLRTHYLPPPLPLDHITIQSHHLRLPLLIQRSTLHHQILALPLGPPRWQHPTTTGATATLPTTNTSYPFTSTLDPIPNQISTNQTQEINQDKETHLNGKGVMTTSVFYPLP